MAGLSIADCDSFDPLASFAAEFYKPAGTIYLDGNSLGLLCKPAEAALMEAVESWRTRAILGWTEGPEPWFEMSRKASGLLAPILGAEPDDVMVGQSTTVNLHQLLATYHDPARPRVLIDEWCFPTDRYAVESHLRLRDRVPMRDMTVVRHRNGLLESDDLWDAIDHSIGIAVLPTVVYRSGQLLDVPSITANAKQRGVKVIWDASHSAGVVPHRFREDGVELAAGCTYKYLNGGPGAVGWLYVHPELRDRLPGLAGWFGCDPDRQFEMSPDFHSATDAGRYMIGTPHVLSLAPLVGALELVSRAGLEAIRRKSLELTGILMLLARKLKSFGVEIVTPRENDERGGHITLAHPAAGKLSRTLRSRGVIPDYRPPNLLRLAPAPLYTSYAECERAIDVLEDILATSAHEHLADRDAPVT